MQAKNFREIPKSHITHSPGGKGTIAFSRIWSEKEFTTRWEFVDHVVLPPGSSIGVHTHGDDEEMYVVLAGGGTMTVDGESRTVKAGDTILNRPHGTHGLTNDTEAELEILVIEVRR